VLNDLNEFILEKFREAEHISESEDDAHKNPEVDAFDYVNQNKKKQKKAKKLTKTQKLQRQKFLTDSSNVLMPSSCEEDFDSYD
jgi:hypothetical protein